MYVEIYVDSLFLINFVMNLYLLLLVNQSAHRTATRLRMILGAAIGAAAYLFPFWGNGYVGLKVIIGVVVGTGLMIVTAFRVKSFKAMLLILERLLLFSFLMGGAMVFLLKNLPVLGRYAVGIFAVMGFGALIYLLITWIMKHGWGNNGLCKVTLIGHDGKVKIVALIDSGNSLVEPISGKPVSVIEKSVFHGLWKEPPELYRVIPYHSIGKRKGMLKGYLLPEIHIEIDGVAKVCRDVYVAVSEESITGDGISMSEPWGRNNTGIRMIVNPILLKNN